MKANLQAELYKLFRMRELYWLMVTLGLVSLVMSIGKVSMVREAFGYFWSAGESNRWLALVNLKFPILALMSTLIYGLFTSWTVHYEYREGTHRRFALLPSSAYEQFLGKYLALTLTILLAGLVVALFITSLLLIFNWNNVYIRESPLPGFELLALSVFLSLKIAISVQGFLSIIFLIGFFIRKILLLFGLVVLAWLLGIGLQWKYFPAGLPVRSIVSWQQHISEAKVITGASMASELTSLLFVALVLSAAYFLFYNHHLYKT